MTLASISQTDLDSRILFETDEIVVVDKPWGVPSTGRQLDDPDSLQHVLMQRYGGMTWAVHQLDADTSGLNVFAKVRKAVPRWQARMRYPSGEKIYVAIVHGEVAADQVIDAPIGIVATEPTRCLGITPDGRRALTRVEVVARRDGFSILRLRIETGRTHQIRIHCSSIGHPLVGERWYREEKCHRHARQALHAADLRFDDGDKPAALHCPLASDLVELLRSLGFGTLR